MNIWCTKSKITRSKSELALARAFYLSLKNFFNLAIRYVQKEFIKTDQWLALQKLSCKFKGINYIFDYYLSELYLVTSNLIQNPLIQYFVSSSDTRYSDVENKDKIVTLLTNRFLTLHISLMKAFNVYNYAQTRNKTLIIAKN